MDEESVQNRQGQLYLLGARGYSAYEVAVLNGYVGTEEEWLESLKGEPGEPGTPFGDLTPEQIEELRGPQGKSAYQVAVDNGFIGTEQEWVNSFLTPDGYYNKDEVDLKKATFVNSVNEMKESDLKENNFVVTAGYYEINDGGGALYKIVDDDTLTDDGGSIIELDNGLFATLLVENDTVNVKQFGAKGDGVTDNGLAFTNALTYIKNKNIGNLFINEGTFIINETQLKIPNGLHMFGTGYKSILQVNELTNEVFITNEHFLNYSYKDTFILENFRINKQAINTGTNGKRCMRFACTDNVTIRNIYFYSDVDSQYSTLDLYSYNSNTLVENCYVLKTGTSGTTLTGGFLIREYSSTRKSENIIFRNLYVEKDGRDEFLWIDAWKGSVENVVVENMTIIDNTTTQNINCIWISGNRDGSCCKNITLKDCYFYKQGLVSRMFNVGHSQLEDVTVYVDNIVIDNCVFECDEVITGDTMRFIDIGEFLIGKGCTVKNCTFINNDTENELSYFITGNSQKPLFYSENNSFFGLSNIGIRRIMSSKNDYFNKAPSVSLFKTCSNIDNVRCDEKIPYLLQVQAETLIDRVTISNIKNLLCTYLLNNSGNSQAISYKIINCEIINDDTIMRNFQTSPQISLKILNSDIKYPQITTNNYIDLTSSGLSVEGESFKGIPSNSYDRNNYPVGTVFFSNTPTKSIVRKITSGDATTDWEEI